jgi:ornithine carbamoyltransferase
MGEPAEVWQQRIDSLKPFQVNHDLLEASGRSDTKFMHCLPAYHDVNTKIGAEIATKFGLNNGIEVTSEVFDSVSNIAFDQAENRLHTIEAVLVGILAEAAIADIQVS